MSTRTLPHSAEAEESLLACLLIDGADTLAAAHDAGVNGATFYDPAARLVFDLIAELIAAGKPADEAVVANELRLRGKLEAIGGLVRLNAITNRIPTTAHRAYYLDQLRALEGCRRVVDIATAATEAAHRFQGSPEDLAGEIADTLARFTTGTVSSSIASLADAEAQAVADEIAGIRQRGTISSTLPDFDAKAGLFAAGEQIILAARPGKGKTSLALQIVHAAAEAGHVALVFSLEMGAGELLRVLAAQRAGVPARGLDRAHPDDQRDYLAALRSLRELKTLRIFDRDTAFERIVARCRAEVVRGPVGLIVLDYLQLIQPPRDTAKAIREQQVAAMSRGFKLLASSIGCPVLTLCQLNRAAENDNREPRLSDLRESGAIEQDANRVLLLHCPEAGRDKVPQTADADAVDMRVILAKHRTGPIGSLWARFHRPTQRFTP